MTQTRKRLSFVKGLASERPQLIPGEPGLDLDRGVVVVGNGTIDPLNIIMRDAAQLVRPKIYSDFIPTSSGDANNYNASYAIVEFPAVTTYEVGMVFNFIAHQNNTGPCIANFQGFGPLPLVSGNNTPIRAGEIVSGQIVSAIFDGVRLKRVSLSAINSRMIVNDYLADGAVDTRVLADNSVTTEKIVNGTIQIEDIDPNAVRQLRFRGQTVTLTSPTASRPLDNTLRAVPWTQSYLNVGADGVWTSGQPTRLTVPAGVERVRAGFGIRLTCSGLATGANYLARVQFRHFNSSGVVVSSLIPAGTYNFIAGGSTVLVRDPGSITAPIATSPGNYFELYVSVNRADGGGGGSYVVDVGDIGLGTEVRSYAQLELLG